jgi:integrase
MASVFRTRRRDGKYHPRYRFEYVDWQGRRRKGTGTTNKSETAKIAASVEAEHDLIRKGHRPPPKSFLKHRQRPYAEITAEYQAWGESQGGRKGKPWGKGHARMRRSHLARWAERLNLDSLADLDGILPRVEQAIREMQTEGRAGKTLSNYAEALHGFCNWCVTRGYLDKNPLDGMASFDTTPKTQRRAMTQDEIHRLLNAAPEDRRLLYETAFCTGLRANELRSLSVSDLSTERGGLMLHEAWTKNRKPGFQPLPAVLVERLSAFAAAGKPRAMYDHAFTVRGTTPTVPDAPLLYVPTHTARSLDMDLDAAGIRKWTPEGKLDFHACRVAYVSFMLEAGAGAKEARELARHRNPDLTMDTYARTRGERLTAITERVGDAILGTNPPTIPQREVVNSANPFVESHLGESGCGFDSRRLHH